MHVTHLRPLEKRRARFAYVRPLRSMEVQVRLVESLADTLAPERKITVCPLISSVTDIIINTFVALAG